MQRQLGLRQAQLRRGGDSGGAGTLREVYQAGVSVSDETMPTSAGDIVFGSQTSLACPTLFETITSTAAGSLGFSNFTPAKTINMLTGDNGGDVYYNNYTQHQGVVGALNPYRAVGPGFPPAWIPEVITTDAWTGAGANGKYGWRRYLPQRGFIPFSWPSPATAANVFLHLLSLHSDVVGNAAEFAQLSALGGAEIQLKPLDNGVTAQLATHWDPTSITSAPGDGPGWTVSTRTGLNDARDVRAVLSPYIVTASIAGAWGWRLWGYDGAANVKLVEADPTAGVRFGAGGLQLPNVNSGTWPHSDAGTIRLVWDSAAGKIKVSVNGGAYANLATVS